MNHHRDVPVLWPEDDFDTTLQAWYAELPADADADALRRARARVLTEVHTDRRHPVMPTPARHARWWPRWSIAAAAVLAVLALVVPHHDVRTGAVVEVSQTLSTAADAQLRTIDAAVPAGQFRYIATHSFGTGFYENDSGTFAIQSGTRVEIWVPADRTSEWTYRQTDTGERTWLIGTAEQAREAGIPDTQQPAVHLQGRCGVWNPLPGVDPCAEPGNWQSPNDVFVASLPRDPQQLFDQLRADSAGHGNDPDLEILVYVTDALRSGLIPADLRAALYRSLALLPTLRIVDRLATLDGRVGTALGITAAGQQQEIIIDPITGEFIGERTRTSVDRDGIPAGTVMNSSSVAYGIAKNAGEPPTT